VYIIARRRWQRERREEVERIERAKEAGGEEVLAGQVLADGEEEVEAEGSVQYGGGVVSDIGLPTPAVDEVDGDKQQSWESVSDRVWRVLPKRYERFELPLSVGVLLLMSALCGLTFVVNVQQAVAS